MGKNTALLWIAGIAAVLIFMGVIKIGDGGVKVDPSALATAAPADTAQLACPDDGDSSLTINYRNGLNSSNEAVDATYYLTGANGDWQTGTDTSDGTEVIDCGVTYDLKLVTTSGAASDHAQITKIELPADGTIVDGGAGIKFTPKGSNVAVRFVGEQGGNLEGRAYSLTDAGFMCNNDNSCTDYEAIGTAVPGFVSTTNGTAQAVGVDGTFSFRLDLRNSATDEDYNDLGTWVLVNFTVDTDYKEPTVKLDGTTLPNAIAQLNTDERTAFAGADYAYKIPASRQIERNIMALQFDIEAEGGVNPTGNMQIGLHAIGQYLGADGFSAKQGAVDDSSSRARIGTAQSILIDLS